MTYTIKALYCPERFANPDINQQYCIGPTCHAFEKVNKGPSYVESRHPYCHRLKIFLQESCPDEMIK